ncbi:Stk1 family PASTA domain-containing Ser/Thr kinase [Antrihabitans stalactiti]|uniref:non-specific serine/threonine protein kinase n=1 Tax=Antrihabitans stalactiti TaxID=2584121 RepID=A0A848KFA2_9NOCA|nr:Stk1 family PASTA domain-containing Ser/Thr kinase [Antrihabitans stalactiti]NMN94870.1 Stk1 family PASTA domain-containing Ser/Thr kinase [Antrihabitans stalactiti]
MRADGHGLIGEMLDRRYRVDAPIARGGMSTVYRGLDVRLDRPVAIKVMDAQYAADPKFLSRFEFEARAVARLKHPGLVAVYDQGVDGDLAFLVMELVEGGTLRELLRERGPMPPHAVRAVAEPVLDALGVAHAAGLVHRDVKPENVLISDSGEVKLADFGLVRAIAASSTTSSSVILGTAAYLSPEQVATGVADARSDVYAMGILIFEMLTGRTPFTGDTSLSIAYQRLHNDVPSPSEFIDGVPSEFDDMVLDSTAREPAHRFVNAAAMAAQLRIVARALDLPDYRVPAPQRSAEHASAQFPRQRAAPPTDPLQKQAPPAPRTSTAVAATPAPPAVAPQQQPQHPQQRPHAPTQHTKVFTASTPRHPQLPPSDPGMPSGVLPANDRPYPAYVDTRRKSRRAMYIWLLIVVLLALLVGIAGWWVGSGRYTAVPSIDGLDRTAAVAAIESAGLRAETQNRYSDTVPANAIIGIDPAAGSQILQNSTVALLISLGKPVIPTIGDNESVAAVQKKLKDMTLEPIDGGETFSTKAAVGSVASLDPGPGTTVAVGSKVKVVRSKGAPPVELPDIRNRSEEDARRALEAVGVKVGETKTEFDDGIDGGKTITTDPAPGTAVTAGSEVTLIVSNAVTVPFVIGQSVSSARAKLTDLGLDVNARSDAGFVIGQLPGGGSRVKPGSSVNLVSFP